MIRRLFFRAAATAVYLMPSLALAQDWALDGMDPVAYQHDGAARAGRQDIVTLWHGKSWHFVSEESRASFEADPHAYAPGLGGRCVVALSEGRAEPGNPRYFVVIHNRTYLTQSAAARSRLLDNPNAILRAAETAFSKMPR